MSEVSSFVILSREKLVTTRQWQDALAAHGFNLELLDEVDWQAEAASVCCRYFGQALRFEYALAPLDQDGLKRLGIADAGARNSVLTFDTTAEHELFASALDFAAMGVATVAAAVLAERTDGVVVEDIDKLPVSADMAVAYGRYIEASTMQLIYERNRDNAEMLFMPTSRDIMPVLQSPRLQALFSRQVEICALIHMDGKPDAAERTELGAINKEIRQIVDDGAASMGTTALREWLAHRLAGAGIEADPEWIRTGGHDRQRGTRRWQDG